MALGEEIFDWLRDVWNITASIKEKVRQGISEGIAGIKSYIANIG